MLNRKLYVQRALSALLIVTTVGIFLSLVRGQGKDGQSAPDSNIAAGQKLFRRHCSECHGSDGLGTERAPSVAVFVRLTEADTLRTFIKNGDLGRGMPSWSRLPDHRLNQLVVFLK